MCDESDSGTTIPRSGATARPAAAPLPEDVLDHVADAVIVLDAAACLTWLNRSARNFLSRLGRSPDAMLGRPVWQGMGELRGTEVERAVRHVLDAREEQRLEFHFPPTDGWYAIRLAPLPAGLVAFVSDVTARHQAEQQRARAEQAELHSRRILDSIGDAFTVFDREWRIAFANARVAELAGIPLRELVGRAAWHLLPGDAGARLADRLRRVAEAGRPATFQLPLDVRPERWLEVHANPTPDGVAAHLYDVTERRRAEERLRFLTTISAELGATLDPQETLERVARLVVPTIADACAVFLVDEQGEPYGVAAFTADPALRDVARRATLAYRPAAHGDASLVLRAIRTGEPQYRPELPRGYVADMQTSPALRAELAPAAPSSMLVVPLVARDAIIGAMALTLDATSHPFGAADQEVAVETGRRAAIAIDNARLYRAAVEANSAKANFLAVMSHELRTPLTAILGYTELMADEVVGPVNETQREQLERVSASGVHLLTLIEEILAFARIEAGQELVRREVVNVADVVQEARAVMEPLLRRKALQVRVLIDEPPPVIRSDAGKLRQILLNLLANAIKFTERGEVQVLVTREDGRLAIAVADTGVGIAPQHIERIFDPFWQVEEARTRKSGGTGLGLSVARRLAHLLDGELTVVSRVGEGTTFRLEVPIE